MEFQHVKAVVAIPEGPRVLRYINGLLCKTQCVSPIDSQGFFRAVVKLFWFITGVEMGDKK